MISKIQNAYVECIEVGLGNTKVKSMSDVKCGLGFLPVWRQQHKLDEFISTFLVKLDLFSETIF